MVDYQSDVVGGGQKTTKEITIKKIEFGKTYPATTFRREIDSRATVFNHVTGKVSNIQVTPVEATTIPANAVRVEPVTDYSSVLILSGLLLGLASIGTAAKLWFRRS